jgi:hypothetical protein
MSAVAAAAVAAMFLPCCAPVLFGMRVGVRCALRLVERQLEGLQGALHMLNGLVELPAHRAQVPLLKGNERLSVVFARVFYTLSHIAGSQNYYIPEDMGKY